MDIQSIKQRFEIIGNSEGIDRAIDTAQRVAPTDISVMVTGENGTGKEVFPKIIHLLSARKHGPYIAVNCGAIPEGTIDSELFGHEKGAFTGAHDSRKGYFEVVNGGTIFLDEVSELPSSTQVRLLRVLESGEFFKVGSSKVIKTDVRVVAASNINIPDAIAEGKFREDLFYRLNTVPISIPALRDRKEDIHLLFRKFTIDFAQKYRMPVVQLDDSAMYLLVNYRWPGNVRQLKNFAEQISIIEKDRLITADTLAKYLPQSSQTKLPVLFKESSTHNVTSERDILYKVLFDMRNDITDMKKLIAEIIDEKGMPEKFKETKSQLLTGKMESSYFDENEQFVPLKKDFEIHQEFESHNHDSYDESEVIEESLSLQKKEEYLIIKALEKHKGKRKYAAKELGISERTLYRKIKEYNINL